MKTILIPKPVTPTHSAQRFTVDIFCRVIDNFGDAGVCLRLARQLVQVFGCQVRLFCDDTALLRRLDPMPAADLSYLDWQAQCNLMPAQGVVCGFGCDVETAYLHAMAAMSRPPQWLHLDYLSAEDWVEGTHGLDSRHPRLGLVQRFCGPGFTVNTGGLLRETHCAPDWSEAQSLATLARLGIKPATGALRLFIFAYEYADFAPLIKAALAHDTPVHWLICQGAAGERLTHSLQTPAMQAQATQGFQVSRIPFVPQSEFDALLRSSHRNWVRGEDSAMRALWAGAPSVWQLYAQDDKVHLTKLRAYLQKMCACLPNHDLSLVTQVHLAANGALPAQTAQTAWEAWLQHSTPEPVALAWRQYLRTALPDLASTVMASLRRTD